MVDFSRHDPLDGTAAVATLSGSVGTAGCFVRVGSEAACLLGSAHVMASVDHAQIFQPPATLPASIEVAVLWDFYGPTNSGQSVNVLDAAIAVVSEGVRIDPQIGDLGSPRGFNPNLVANERVWMHGAGSGQKTSGQILQLNDSPTVVYDDGSQAQFSGLAKCERYSVAGDSGAAVMDSNGYIVGVHLCGTTEFSWFCPIQVVQARWPQIQLIT